MDPTFLGMPAPVPHANKKGANIPIKIAALVIGVVFIFALIFTLVSALSQNTGKYDGQRLLWRLKTVYDITNNSRSRINDPDLSKVNAEVGVVIIGDYNTLSGLIPTVKMDPEAKKYQAAEKTHASDTETTLNTARVNGIFDSTYAPILRDELAAIQKAAVKLYGTTTKSATKTALKDLSDHIDTELAHIDALSL